MENKNELNEIELKQQNNSYDENAKKPEDKSEKGRDIPEHDLAPRKEDYEAELTSIINSNAPATVKLEQIDDYHENDIAGALEDLDPAQRQRLYKLLGIDRLAEIFAYLEEPEEFIEELDPEVAADILEKMEPDDAVDILEELEDEKSDELVGLMENEAREDIDLIQSYDEDEIGSKMTTNYVAIYKGLTIKEAMKSMISQAADNDNISTIYVVDDEDVFYGAIDLTDLIIARSDVPLDTLVTTSYPYVFANETIDETIEDLKDYSEDSVPVLDNDKHILGVITSQDIVEVVDEEMGEDYAKLAGLTEEEDLEETLLQSLKKRTPWLITLLFLGLIVATVTSTFEAVISQITVIVFFQSVILGMSGNVGTQTLGVTIRVLMDEELTWKEQMGFVFKEIKVGFCNGLIVGIISFIVTGGYIHFIKGQSATSAFAISACIGGALWIAMIISSFVGAMVPIIFDKLKIDPAVASGPLISTVNDLVAVVTYYSLAWAFLINVLHLGS